MTGGTANHTVKHLYTFSAVISPEMLKLCRVTKVKVFFVVLGYICNVNLYEFLVAILEKGLINPIIYVYFLRIHTHLKACVYTKKMHVTRRLIPWYLTRP